MKYSEYLMSRRPANKEKERIEQHVQELLALWRATAASVAGSSNCVRETSAGDFAKQVVLDYQKFCAEVGWPI
jgi:hypothetical protein